MKIPKRWVIVAAVAIALAIGVVWLVSRGPSYDVTIRLHNASNWRVRRATVVYGEKPWKTATVTGLDPGETKVTGFHLPRHEGAYKLAVDFEGHGCLKGGGEYVERGFVTDETIRASRIKTAVHVCGY